MQARGKAAQSLWQAYVAQRGHSMMTMPSSKNLWDVVNRQRLEPHGAEAVGEIWMEVRREEAFFPQPAACCWTYSLQLPHASTSSMHFKPPAPPRSPPPRRRQRAHSAIGCRHLPHVPAQHTRTALSAALQFHADPSKNRIATVMSAAKYAKFQEFAAKR